jgi:3-carboxy-cis,cis-muconate cycloisomerase
MVSLFDPIFGASALTAATDGRAWVSALTRVEAALARAEASVGLLDAAQADLLVEAAGSYAASDDEEIASLAESAVAGGNPVIPLVERLRTLVAAQPGGDPSSVHLGATSQDVLDSAAMLVTREAITLAAAATSDCAGLAADLAGEHRATPMVARTLMQQAVPTTFGALAAGWAQGLDRAGAQLRRLSGGLSVQFGGAGGTLAAVHPHGPAIRAALAEELGLADPGSTWHTERTRLAELAAGWGALSMAVGKVATDVIVLSQNEIGEVREGRPGGSSAMAHKRNPAAAIAARAAAAQCPGLVATLLACGGQELQRGAGGWHAEWPALVGLIRSAGGAAYRLRDSLTGLDVDAAAMARNLAGSATGAATPADLDAASDLVDRYLNERSEA